MRNLIIISIGLMFVSSCNNEGDISPNGISYKQEMRKFVIGISQYSKSANANFQVIPQNGIELATSNGEDDGMPDANYLNAIDGNGQEDLFYGYDFDDQSTPTNDNSYLRTLLDVSKNAGNTIIVTDYTSTPSKMDDSYTQNNSHQYVSFAADERELNNIPNYPSPIFNENDLNITSTIKFQ